MRNKTIRTSFFIFILASLLLAGCSAPTPTATAEPINTKPVATAVKTPDWFAMELTNVQTGETCTMNDFAGKVVLVETMAQWCPNCIVQANYVKDLHELLDNPDDLISVSLDVDLNEDEASLKEYASSFGFDWHFAVSPLLVSRALGNLYSAQYLNPPLNPMLIIDREGNVHHLEYGKKDAEALRKVVEPYLAK